MPQSSPRAASRRGLGVVDDDVRRAAGRTPRRRCGESLRPCRSAAECGAWCRVRAMPLSRACRQKADRDPARFPLTSWTWRTAARRRSASWPSGGVVGGDVGLWISAVIGAPGVNDDRQFRPPGDGRRRPARPARDLPPPTSWALSHALFSRSSNDRYRPDDGLRLTDGMRHCRRPPCRSSHATPPRPGVATTTGIDLRAPCAVGSRS